jgi:hypothetical protein
MSKMKFTRRRKIDQKINTEYLLGASVLVKDAIYEIKHSNKKVLGLSLIAVAMGMYRP